MNKEEGRRKKEEVRLLRRNVGASKPFTFSLLPFTSARMRRGFTMVEVVVVMSMLVLVGSMVLASFPRLSQRINLQRSSQQLALSLRKAQNMAFAVRQVNAPGGRIIPPAFGLYFNRATPNSYLIFGDLKGPSGVNDGLYRPADDVAVETIQLGPGISLGELVADIGGAESRQEVINISFSVPEARMTIANASSPVGESVEIFLGGSAPSQRRSVVVRTTGQIYVK